MLVKRWNDEMLDELASIVDEMKGRSKVRNLVELLFLNSKF